MMLLLLLLMLGDLALGLMNTKYLLNKFDALETPGDLFVCPSSLAPLQKVYRQYAFVEKRYYSSSQFNTRYAISSDFIDFTVKSEATKPFWELSSRERIGQSFFQLPSTSFVYERGYRQQFETVGFPGIEKEFQEINAFFSSANAQTVLDLSCGSGFMTRRLIKSGNYERVLGADLSPSMLQETRSRCLNDGIKTLPTLVRCDSAQLPFRSGSLDAIHAGAALHCWPRINQTLSEIYRVLKPGGVFYASTFVNRAASPLKKQANQQGFYLFESTDELHSLVTAAGFGSSSSDTKAGGDAGGRVVVRKEGVGCAIVKAVKFPIDASIPLKL